MRRRLVCGTFSVCGDHAADLEPNPRETHAGSTSTPNSTPSSSLQRDKNKVLRTFFPWNVPFFIPSPSSSASPPAYEPQSYRVRVLDAEKYNQTQNLAEGAKDFCGKVSQLNDIVKSVVEAVDQQVSERRHASVDAGMLAFKKKKKN